MAVHKQWIGAAASTDPIPTTQVGPFKRTFLLEQSIGATMAPCPTMTIDRSILFGASAWWGMWMGMGRRSGACSP